ncbi:MAG: RNA 2'-phosphotransferase [Theionarchaea archaeon]|nr:RNA 2'-phosphotransferase [Theionarchaea archaeon]
MNSNTTAERKQKMREKIWKKMKKKKIERFPYAWGRIPNFKGAEHAAEKVAELEEFQNAYTIFVAPDSPQRRVRELVLVRKKLLVMPTPRLKSGFLVVTPITGKERKASSIKGAFTYGERFSVEEIPAVDFVVQGAVAVDCTGGRLGKGGGYGDREIAVLQEHGKMSSALIAVTVHDVQVVKELPQDEWDFTADIIVTPTRVIDLYVEREAVPKKKEAVSKYMSYVLRHHPPETMMKNGFLPLDDLLRLVQKKYDVDIKFIQSVVKSDEKERFQIRNNKIRAIYGHSVPVLIPLPEADIDILYHGTTENAAHHILKEGLQSKGRQKVHLSPTVKVAVEVGKRKCKNPVVLQINVRKASKEGVPIEKASDLVYVADFIPPEYISVKKEKNF